MKQKSETSAGYKIKKIMKNLFATFETWSIADGNYDPFHKGQKVSFAFEMHQPKYRRSIKKQCYLKQRKFSDYSFCAKVIGNYAQEGMDGVFLVVDTGSYKFFILSFGKKFPYQEGDFIVGKGQITVDYFIWGEQSYKIVNVPDIYYNFIIEKILFVKIPATYYNENNDVIIFPTSLSSSQYTDIDIIEIEDMASTEEDEEMKSALEDDNISFIKNPSFTLFELKLID
jgi:hypothetical protein